MIKNFLLGDWFELKRDRKNLEVRGKHSCQGLVKLFKFGFKNYDEINYQKKPMTALDN